MILSDNINYVRKFILKQNVYKQNETQHFWKGKDRVALIKVGGGLDTFNVKI